MKKEVKKTTMHFYTFPRGEVKYHGFLEYKLILRSLSFAEKYWPVGDPLFICDEGALWPR